MNTLYSGEMAFFSGELVHAGNPVPIRLWASGKVKGTGTPTIRGYGREEIVDAVNPHYLKHLGNVFIGMWQILHNGFSLIKGYASFKEARQASLVIRVIHFGNIAGLPLPLSSPCRRGLY